MKIVLGPHIEIEIDRGMFYAKIGTREICLSKGLGLVLTGKRGTWHIDSTKIA